MRQATALIRSRPGLVASISFKRLVLIQKRLSTAYQANSTAVRSSIGELPLEASSHSLPNIYPAMLCGSKFAEDHDLACQAPRTSTSGFRSRPVVAFMNTVNGLSP